MGTSLGVHGLTALTWTFVAVATILSAGRFALRIRDLGRLQVDDVFHGFALLVLIGYAVTYTLMFPVSNFIESFSAGLGPAPTDADFNHYFHLELAVTLLFWIIVYSVKFSFLFLYRAIFNISPLFMKAWWGVFGFTAGTFLMCFLSVFWMCDTPGRLLNLGWCLAPVSEGVQSTMITMWVVLNVISDVSIVVLPISMLRALRVSLSQKLGLAAIFSIAIADTIFDITRTIATLHGGAVALDTIWCIIEPAVAVIVSCLPAYRSVFRKPETEKSYGNSEYASGFRSNQGRNGNGVGLGSVGGDGRARLDSEEYIVGK